MILLRVILIIAFINSCVDVPKAQAGEMVHSLMPAPGTMVHLSTAFTPAHLEGLTIHPDNALQFDFLINKGDGQLDNDQKKEEYTKLVKYFLASLTIPDEDQWVNLSPYEHNRIIQDNFGKTQMGRDLLSQDYFLKQITSSLMYPESGLGKLFWDKVYARAYKEYGSTNIPVNTFNKVWIVPDEAVVYESGNTAYIVKSHLKVMLEEDYLSLEKHSAISVEAKRSNTHTMTSKIVREIILPEIESEVNEGKNFSMLRQIYSGMVLATWYKKALKESLLGRIYADKAKVKYIGQDYKANEEIYQKYLIAFKKGVYNYIKEDTDKYTHQAIARRYFSGGFDRRGTKEQFVRSIDLAQSSRIDDQLASRYIDDAQVVLGEQPDQAMRTINFRTQMGIDSGFKILDALQGDANKDIRTKFWKIYNDPNITDETIILIARFIYIPGINNVIASISATMKDKRGYVGFVAELYHALYLEKEGYKILIFDLEFPAMEIDIVVQKHRQIYFVEVKNLSTGRTVIPDSPNVSPLQDKIDTIISQRKNGDNRLKKFADFIDLIRSEEAGRQRVIDQMVGQLGKEAAEDLVRQIQRSNVDVIFSLTHRMAMTLTVEGVLSRIAVPMPLKSEWLVGKNLPRSLVIERKRIESKLRTFGKEEDFRVDILFRPYRTFRKSEEIPKGASTLAILTELSVHRAHVKTVSKNAASKRKNAAMITLPGTRKMAQVFPGGIDLNSAHMNLQIRRDGRGAPLPLPQQDMAQLSSIQGFDPVIIEIKPVTALFFIKS